MNIRYILIGLAAWAATAFGQQVNPRLSQLDAFLRQQPYGVEFSQTNDFDENYIRYRWHAQLDTIGEKEDKPVITREMSQEARQQARHIIDGINERVRKQLEDALDTIRIAFASVSKDAAESYRYEYHQGRSDTIVYSVAFCDDDRMLDSHHFGNYVEYWNASEAANFRYEKSFGHYYHVFKEPRRLSEEDMKPFDVAAFEAHIQPALKSMMKLQGAKSYSVYWQHDKEYVDSTGRAGLLLYGGRLSSDPQAGLTTGTHYFIPAQHKAEPLFQQLDSLAHDYVNRHPKQPYRYTQLPIILRILPNGSVYKSVYHTATGDIVESDDDDSDDLNSTKYNLRCYQDDEGLHILSLTTKGVLWIPKDFQKLKRWVNGKATYRKN